MQTSTSTYHQSQGRHLLHATQLVLLTLCTEFCATQSLAQPEATAKIDPQSAQFQSPQQKPNEVAPDTLTAIEEMEEAQATKISLSVKDATVADTVQAIYAATPKPKKIEVRGAEVISITLAFKAIELGNVLKATAALCGCNLYVLSDHFLIAKPHLVTKIERRYAEGASQRRSMRQYAFGQNVVREMQKLQVNAITLREMSPNLQNMVQKMADLQAEMTYWQKTKLPGDTIIALETTGNSFTIRIVLKSQQHTYTYLNIVP